MQRLYWIIWIFLMTIFFGKQNVFAQKNIAEDCIFFSSLHYSARGMEYWYKKENGGLETITGIPYSDLGCKNCHIKGCDECHEVQKQGKSYYSTIAAGNQGKCLKCHARERAIMKIDHEANQEDVHFTNDMKCMDCHSAKEMHGDGIEYSSMRQDGAMDTQCENCHDDIKPTNAHTAHNDKVDCKACHLRHVVSCTNCHFDLMVEKGKRMAIPVSGWIFLINHKGKVTSGSMQTFVTQGNKTFLMFAPHMSHSIMKNGRKCEECHGSKISKQVLEGQVNLTWLKDGKVENLKGVIPVVKGVNYECVYQDRKEGKWIPIENPSKPLVQYPAYGEPLTQEQLEKLVKVYKIQAPDMK